MSDRLQYCYYCGVELGVYHAGCHVPLVCLSPACKRKAALDQNTHIHEFLPSVEQIAELELELTE